MTEKSILKKLHSSHSTGVDNHFVNLCPHELNFHSRKQNKLTLSIPPSGTICGVDFSHEPLDDAKNPLADYDIEARRYPVHCKSITGLPDFELVKQNNLWLFVSSFVLQEAASSIEYSKYAPYMIVPTPDRSTVVRDDEGRIVGNYSISLI